MRIHLRQFACALALGMALHTVPVHTSIAQLEDPEAEEDREGREVEPAPTCWAGLDDFDRTTDLDAALAFIRRAMLDPDPMLHAYLGRRLASLIGGDADRARRVLEAARLAESEDEMRLLMGALGSAEAAGDPSLLGPLLAAAEEDLASLYGGLALQTIKHQPTLDDDALKRVTALAYEPAGSNASLAIAALGDVMTTAHVKHGEDHGRYLAPMLEMAESVALHPDMNAFALEMPSYANPIYTPAELARIAALMHEGSEPEMRINAAHLLGAQGRSDVLREEFQRAFAAERSFCVRYIMIAQIGRALGPDIVPFLEWAVALEPRLAEDLQDYREIYASGEVDFERVYRRKPFRYRQCLDHADYDAE